MKVTLKDFGSRAELYKYLHAHRKQLMAEKRMAVKTFVDTPSICAGECKEVALKGATGEDSHLKFVYENGDGVLKRSIVANTYYWMDSHDDVHLNNLFAKSIQERGLRIPHMMDHKFQLSSKIGKSLELSEQKIRWSRLGVDKTGFTQALIPVSEIRDRSTEVTTLAYNMYLNDEIDQHSVAMLYVTLYLAINDNKYEEEYKVWQNVINKIGNKEVVIEQGFFWGIAEAKLREYSAVVMGSNEITPTLNENKNLPGENPTIEVRPEKKSTLDINKLLNHYSLTN